MLSTTRRTRAGRRHVLGISMRQNGPVTGKEVLLPPGAELVSSTDLRGNIQYFNEHFRDICGFSEEELQSAPHTLIRHPHMTDADLRPIWAPYTHACMVLIM